MIFGDITSDDVRDHARPQLPREVAIFAPLIVHRACWMGIYPVGFLHPMQPAIAHIVQIIEAA